VRAPLGAAVLGGRRRAGVQELRVVL
jgi:hypothetical protein